MRIPILAVMAALAWAVGQVAALATDATVRNDAPPDVFTRGPIAAVSPSPGAASGAPSRHPAAAKAYLVLETYCARCHQSGKSAALTPPSSFANILDLDDIARVPGLVRPGNPDGSTLYLRMFQHGRGNGAADDSAPSEPSASEIEAVRDWIDDLGSRRDARKESCAAVPRVRAADVDAAIGAWLSQIGAERARDTRFLTVAHLENACASDAELAAWRQAMVLALNSLSWSPTPARVEAIGDTLSVFSIRLSELGWVAAHWEKLAAAYPAGAGEPSAPAIAEATGTAVPILRADWLASTALRSPLYTELLGLPDTLAELKRLFGVEQAARGAAAGGDQTPIRLMLRSSLETQKPRLIERRLAKGMPFWIAYELPQRGEGRELLEQPLASVPGALGPGPAPVVRSGGRETLPVEGVRTLFSLPNGIPGMAAFDGDGRRLIDHRLPAHAPRVPSLGCQSCHASGPIRSDDEMRLHIDSDKFSGDAALRDAARRVYPPAAELQRIFEDDRGGVRRAYVAAGVDPDLRVHGLGLVSALARQYDMDVGVERAAAEFGLDMATFVERLKSYDGAEEIQILAMRLRQGPIARSEAERLYAALRSSRLVTATASAASAARAAVSPVARTDGGVDGGAALKISFWSEQTGYRTGELLALYAVPSGDCHLTVIGIDPNGKATVLFPNDLQQDNLVRGGRIHRVPSADAGYQLRLKEKGLETLIAICDSRQKAPDGVEHDFERQRFTVLGNWRNFLRTSLEETAGARSDAARTQRSRGRRVARGRDGGEARADQRSDARGDGEQRTDGFARAAIQVVVD
jgi:hypothetical protein